MQLKQSIACSVGALPVSVKCIAICLCEEVNDPVIHYNSSQGHPRLMGESADEQMISWSVW